MDYIHSKGYLHLDIKPQNILLSESLKIKIADFGSSWLFCDDKNDQISEVKGTSYFLAPESIYDPKKNQYNYSYFSGRLYDVWTVGMTIYVLVFNELPYKPQSKGLSDITKAIIEFELDFEKAADPLAQSQQINLEQESSSLEPNTQRSSKRRHISEGLKFFLCKMLEKDP